MLPSHWEWEFIDADIECDAAPGIDGIYPGPYLSYFRMPSIDKIQEIHEWVYEVIEEDGPFDGVLGFSEASSRYLRACTRGEMGLT